MAFEDNFLRLDPAGNLTEAEKRVIDNDFDINDVVEIYSSGFISKDEYEKCLEILGENND